MVGVPICKAQLRRLSEVTVELLTDCIRAKADRLQVTNIQFTVVGKFHGLAETQLMREDAPQLTRIPIQVNAEHVLLEEAGN